MLSKKEKRLINRYHREEISHDELKKEIGKERISKLFLKGKIILAPKGVRYDIFKEKKLESELTPEELEIRKEFLEKKDTPISESQFDGHHHVTFSMEYTDEQLKKLKKIPVKTARKVLTPKEFKIVRREVYELD